MSLNYRVQHLRKYYKIIINYNPNYILHQNFKKLKNKLSKLMKFMIEVI